MLFRFISAIMCVILYYMEKVSKLIDYKTFFSRKIKRKL